MPLGVAHWSFEPKYDAVIQAHKLKTGLQISIKHLSESVFGGHLKWRQYRDEYNFIREEMKKYPVKILSIHSTPLKMNNKEDIEKSSDTLVGLTKHAEKFGSEIIVFHALNPNVVNIVEKVLPIFEEKKITLCVENLDGIYTKNFLNSKDLLWLIEMFNSPYFKACVDVSHALFAGVEPIKLIEELKDFIGCVHLSESSADTHYPFNSENDYWLDILKALKPHQQVPWIIELRKGFADKIPYCVDFVRKHM